nr:uncharacterized protein LOC117277413 [Nicotiana tomentosiformis]
MAEEDIYTKDGSVDNRNKPANRKKTGTWKKRYQEILREQIQTQSDIDQCKAYYKAARREKKRRVIWSWISSKMLLCAESSWLFWIRCFIVNTTFEFSININRESG